MSFFKPMQLIFRGLFLGPFALVYGLGQFLDRQFKRGLRPKDDLVSLCIGNLSAGGEGKTPHLAAFGRYLLGQGHKFAVLSRGYGRLNDDICEVQKDGTLEQFGDEALLLRDMLHTSIPIVLASKRRKGMAYIQKNLPEVQFVLFDDGLQHWDYPTDLNLVLSTWQRPFFKDFLLPLGRLREPRNGIQRADALILTKCPENTQIQSESIRKQANLQTHQALFFTQFQYKNLESVFEPFATMDFLQVQCQNVLLFCGLGQPRILSDFLKSKCLKLHTNFFPDHHSFSKKEIEKLILDFEQLPQPKILLCTRKDAMRLKQYATLFQNYPLYCIEPQVQALGADWCVWAEKQLISLLKKPKP